LPEILTSLSATIDGSPSLWLLPREVQKDYIIQESRPHATSAVFNTQGSTFTSGSTHHPQPMLASGKTMAGEFLRRNEITGIIYFDSGS
jgi:hypothetical protein